MSFWKSWRRSGDETYRPGKLVDYRQNADFKKTNYHIICDIDKTYLETEFESISRMVRIAFEDAHDKVTVSGASDFLEVARWYSLSSRGAAISQELLPRPLHFVSSSPPQLRSVLEEKLLIDGVDWTSATFKNQAYNIKMGRVDLLRQHVAYKTLAILGVVNRVDHQTKFIMIGDNAETDAYIYLGIKFFLEGSLSPEGLCSYLEIAGVEQAVANEIKAEAMKRHGEISVSAIMIRSVPGYKVIECPPLTDHVQLFNDYFDASLLLMQEGLVEPEALWQLVRRFHNQHGYSLGELGKRLEALHARVASQELLQKQIERVLAKMKAVEGAAAGNKQETKRDLPPESQDSQTADAPPSRAPLVEDEILRYARVWMQMIRLHKKGHQ